MPSDSHVERLLVIDFGAQYTQLIARRIREAGVYCEIHPFDAPESFIRDFGARGIVLSGGPETVTEDATPRIPDVVFELNDAGYAAARHLLRHAGARAAARRTRGEFADARVRSRAHSRIEAVVGAVDEPAVVAGRRTRRLDEPRRQGRRAAARIRIDRIDRRARRLRRWKTPRRQRTPCSFIRRSRIPPTARRSSAASRATSADAADCGRRRTSSPTRSRRCASRSAMRKSCSVCRAASIRASSRRCCRARSAIS